MMAYINGDSREQGMLLPDAVEDYIEEDNPTRVILAFVGVLDFEELGFGRARPSEIGRPGYDPRMMMAMYLWGYVNGIRSSRKLERECKRNLELIWLTEGLKPDFKTIADFRKANGEAIQKTLAEFQMWCRRTGLFGGQLVAVDGTKIKAVNSKQLNYNHKKLDALMKSEQTRIASYLREMDELDKEEQTRPERMRVSKESLRKKIEKLKKYNERHKSLKKQLAESSENEISLTDRDSRRMRTSSGLEVCYNLQTVVDAKHKLIVVHEVSNASGDQGKLYDMAARAKEELAAEELSVVADAAYFSQSDLKRCEEENITTYIPVPSFGNPKEGTRFSRDVFQYDQQRDIYICPQGQELKLTSTTQRNNKQINYYETSACHGCPIRKQCTTSKNGRRIKRWVDEAVTDRLKQRLRDEPEMIPKRKTIVEHPYGTIKRAMNQGYFLLKGLRKVAIEANLTVLAYNMKRAISILGVVAMTDSLELK